MTIDRYDLEARYAPALVCSVPFVLLGYYYLLAIDSRFVNSLLAISVGGVTLSIALFSMMVFTCRTVGKKVEIVLFDSGKKFPTTIFLLRTDKTLSKEYKQRIYTKVRDEFGIDLSSSSSDSPANRKIINEAVAQIRKTVYRKNPLVQERNIYYGIARNYTGGSMLALAVSLISLLISLKMNNSSAVAFSIILSVSYLAVLIASYVSIRFTAKQYALSLFDEFLH